MREIKFRAWDNKAKEWLLGYDEGELGGFSLFGECMLLGEWSHILNEFILQQRNRTPEDLVVMQYTGLKDKNGKEIYEGDVITFLFSDNSEERKTYQVEWFKHAWRLDRLWLLTEIHSIEVIGNIYANPELLQPDVKKLLKK